MKNKPAHQLIKQSVILAVLLLLPFITVGAQKKLLIASEVFDKVTQTRVLNCKVQLLRSDSTIIDSTETSGMAMENNVVTKRYSFFGFNIDVPGSYIIKVVHKGYDTLYSPLKIDKVYRREYNRKIPNLFLQRTREHTLSEVSVVATKIKFYNKGDTLVYNADAFQLSEGSVLDEFIRQLPGAELKSDGRIYVNGRFVESLLLNGKDFFKGDNHVMLDNLPTYMVKDIKVYNKSSDNSELAINGIDKKSLVMDVNLKKQYSIGWIGNTEVGGGSASRFLARLFAMRFTDHSRLTVYANVNNTNDTRKPGQDNDWTPEKMPSGMKTTRMAGLDYNIDTRESKLNMRGDVQLSHTDNKVINTTNRTNFLSGGDTYDRIVNSSRNCDFNISTKHSAEIKINESSMLFKPSFKYHKYRNTGSYLSATSEAEWSSLDKEYIDSLFVPILTEKQKKNLINRNLQQSLNKGYSWNTDIPLFALHKFKHVLDYIVLCTELKLNGANDDMFSRNRIDYFNGNASTDYRNQYATGNPGRGYDLLFKAQYTYYLSKGFSLSFYYKYNQVYKYKSHSLYRLDRLNGWDESSEHEIGSLPSVEEYEQVIDASNSYRSHFFDKIHTPGIDLWWNHDGKNKSFWFAQASLSFPFHAQRMHYERAAVDTTFTRHHSLFQIDNTFLQWNNADESKVFFVGYDLYPDIPDMAYAVNVIDNSNPLNVMHGNGNLKDAYKHYFNISYTYKSVKSQFMISPYLNFNYTQNALAMGYVYDKTTGRRDITPDNLNGNWDITPALNISTPINKKKTLTLNNTVSAGYIHNVDLVGVDGMAEAQRSTVKTWNLNETFKLEWTLGDQKLSFKTSVTNLHSTGSLDNFETINAYNYNYGIIGTFKLPWKINFGADMTMYSRRGYEESAMNDDDFVCNARLSRPFFKGKVILAADAFDIFHQLTNVQRYMNAQARTETRVNVIPRYVMLHCIYRLNLNPKKKK
jgi:hypothetical protein